MLGTQTRLFAILGYPIKHSLSPLIQNNWFKEESFNCAYLAFEVPPVKLKKTIDSLKTLGFVGLNITVPLKTEMFKLVDYPDKAAKATGSVNTVMIKDGKLYGYNTDHSGLGADLISKGINLKNKDVFIYGAGGAAKAVIYLVKASGAKNIYLANRTQKNGNVLAKKFDITSITAKEIPDTLASADIIINASACGLKSSDSLPFEVPTLKKKAIVYDLIYKTNTPFAKMAKKKKVKFYTGEGMLINQGAHGFKIWTGVYPNTKSGLKLLKKNMR